jgi:magnesium-transporting ATPase (P-type)
MRKYFKQILIPIILTIILILPYFVFGAEESWPLQKLKEVGSANGPYQDTNEFGMAIIVGTVVNAFLGLLGVIFIILIISAGYNWMTAAGNEEKVTKAKDTMTRAIIGLIIVVGAFAIWYFIDYNFLSK